MNRQFPKKTYRWLTDTWKDAQHHSSPGKYKPKSQWDTTSHQSEWLKLTTQETTDCWQGCRERRTFCTAGRNANCAATLENSMEVPQKLKIELPHDTATALLGIYPKDTKMLIRKGTCTPMFVAVLSTIANYGKTPNGHQLMNG